MFRVLRPVELMHRPNLRSGVPACVCHHLRINSPFPSVRNAERKRAAVPALPMKSSAFRAGIFPPKPVTVISQFWLIKLNIKAQGLQRFGKVTRVIGKEGVGKASFSVCKGGDQQGAIGQ